MFHGSISRVIGYEDLANFIREEFLKSKIECEEQKEQIYEIYDRLENLKLTQQEKEEEYQIRQKQVTLYLECKKSFFGKIRYYLRGKKKIKDMKSTEEILRPLPRRNDNKEELIYDNKEYYTIEDLIDVTKILERNRTQIRNATADIKAIEASIQRLTKRIENAKSYIEEIEEHKKSIFEFWRFVGKDDMLALNEPEEIVQEPRKIEKKFDYKEDGEEVGKKLDKQNRSNFTKEELDSAFLASTDILQDMIRLRQEDEERPDFSEHIEEIKKQALEEEMLFESEDFDIFGSMTEDKTKINSLGNTKHREIKKSKFRLLEINKNTSNDQYTENLISVTFNLDRALENARLGMPLNAFLASTGALNNKKYSILHLNPKNALDSLKEEEKVNLYNIKLSGRTKAIALTNIVYYDNSNLTLPLGMDVSDEIITDMSKLKLEPKKQKLFRINQELDEINVKTKIICVYEYEVMEE